MFARRGDLQRASRARLAPHIGEVEAGLAAACRRRHGDRTGAGQRLSPERVQAFAAVLLRAGIVTTVRKTRGDDVDAACGQLAGQVQDKTRRTVRLKQVMEDR